MGRWGTAGTDQLFLGMYMTPRTIAAMITANTTRHMGVVMATQMQTLSLRLRLFLSTACILVGWREGKKEGGE